MSHGASGWQQTWRCNRRSTVLCLPDSSMPSTHCVLLWSDGGCRHEFTTNVFELLSELALEFSSLVVNQPSRHTKGSNPVFEEVVPDDFRMLDGNHGNDTKKCSQGREGFFEAQLVAIIIYKHEHINGCCVTKPPICAKSCRQVETRMMLTLAHIASQLWRCANCSCATSSDTFGSRKCIIRRVTQSCVQSASTPPRRSVQAPTGLWVGLAFAWQEMLVVVSRSGRF